MAYNLTKKGFYIISAIVSWLALLIIDNSILVPGAMQNHPLLIKAFSDLFFAGFTLSILLCYKYIIGNFAGEGFNDLLWKMAVTGLVVILIITGNNLLIFKALKDYESYTYLIDSISYHVVLAISTIFVCSSFYVYKKMILYQKSKEVVNLWKIFEYLTYSTIAFTFFNLNKEEILFQLAFIPLVLMGLILSINLKWIAYLNVKQKINSIIYIGILFSLTIILTYNIFDYSLKEKPVTDLTNSIFILSLLFFIALYSIISLLVLVFNLPTSSVFEKKFEEIINFQKLSKSVQVGKTEEEVYKLLIESCSATLMANTCILEILDTNQNPKRILYKNIDKERYDEIKSFLNENKLDENTDYMIIDDLKKEDRFDDIEYMGYRSLLSLPLNSYNEKLGTLYLLSDVKNGFEKEMIDIVVTYVNQACTSISNFRLINLAVKNARYIEELAIARKVQYSLLPQVLINDSYLEMASTSVSADEVGGDYYDFVHISEQKYHIVIGDVSGKGTSAAFHMAKLKGIYQTLVQLNLRTDEFMQLANKALAACLEKSSFVTLTIVILDFENWTLETSRAGHCPTLYFDNNHKTAEFLEQAGLGLGILRNKMYDLETTKQLCKINHGDIIMLFTDGIAEATNELDQEYGYDRIKDFMNSNYDLNIQELKTKFLKELHEYCNGVVIDDDYTVLFIKIK